MANSISGNYHPLYRFEFSEAYLDQPGLYPSNDRYRVGFYKRDYNGPLGELTPGGEPVTIKCDDGSVDDLFTPLFASKATFALVAEPHWEVSDFYVTNQTQLLAVVARYEGDEDTYEDGFRPVWSGFVQPLDIKENYGSKPYEVEINAACGLNLLKEKLVATLFDGKRFTGFPTFFELLESCLRRTEQPVFLPILTVVNLFETADMAAGQSLAERQQRDPLARTRLNAESLKDDNGQSKNAYDVLIDILTAWGCRLSQVDGMWVIVRITEAPGGWNVWSADPESVMTRRYVSSVVSLFFESKNLSVPVGRTRPVQAVSKAQTWGLPIKRAVSVAQEFGGYVNHLPNGDFSQRTGTSPIGRLPTLWTQYANGNFPAVDVQTLGDGSEADPFRLRIYGAGTNRVNDRFRAVRQQVVLSLTPSAKRFSLRLRGRFRLINARSAMLYVIGVAGGGIYLLKPEGSWLRNPKKKENLNITLSHVYRTPGKSEGQAGWQTPKTGWCDIDQRMDPLSGFTQLIINLCEAEALDGQTNNPRPYIEYADMRLEVVQEGQELNGITAVKRLSETDRKPEPDMTITYGDVPDAALPYERTGSTFQLRTDAQVATTRWYRPDANILTDYSQGRTKLNWLLAERANQQMQFAQAWDGTLIGRLPWGIFSVLRFDDILGPDGNPAAYQLTAHEWKIRSGFHKVTAVESVRRPLGKPIEAAWETPDGQIPLETDADDTPVVPTTLKKFNPLLSELRPLLKNIKFGLTASGLPDGLIPLDPEDRQKYNLIAEVRSGSNLLGRVQAVARKQTFSGFF